MTHENRDVPVGLDSVPAIDLGGGLVVYDAFVIRALHESGVRLPQETAPVIAYEAVGRLLSSGWTDEFALTDTIGKSVWTLFVKHPPAPPVRDSAYVAAVWRYLLVPSALVSVAACLDYWTGRNMRNLTWSTVNGRAVAYGHPSPKLHADEYVRAKQVLFEALGNTEGAKYANALASRVNPRMWIKQLRKREGLTRATLSDLGFPYRGLLRWPFTVEDDDERLVVSVLDNHLRHPSGPYLPHKREPTFHDYGAACATTYALLLTLLYNDTTGRLVNLLPALDSIAILRQSS
ncbi:MAG: hypothetical protein OXG19_08880 [Chloroflexi bacterium]|nr:hypothetical protein [Chloroflexota bacterium]